MDLHTLRSNHSDIMDCEVKDSTGLNDFQKLSNEFGVAIPKVGIERFRIPLKFKHDDGSIMSHDCEASMFVFCDAHKNGVNMSRFCAILQEESEISAIDNAFFKKILHRYRTDLRDSNTEELIPESFLKLDFKFPVKQKSLKSENWGWQYYNCSLEGRENRDGQVIMSMTVNFEYSSTCPCSLSMAKQYEKGFASGEITEGNGIATAHSQRSNATVTIDYNMEKPVSLIQLIEMLRIALPTETQSLVKRLDEQAFAILNGENPMFVEHSSRRISAVLNQEEAILDWKAKVEHFESLHSHNAVAYISK
ncbi:GTP cyclohydrolase FolE2 [Halobacteriovorax sp. JY17]|uniref:GTP cyclohydrolase FolE2 n=1 Tax=Halobacteriovorax sp. JY17 TaxID=2014617 RepID=UPI000C6496AB|nr:GTP cyclohydrolase FolE2 [Halobacteriovorax sp. JY17]PIK16604.1 MAG: GTP cyclohydrolase [Halobacteriovorax sp. JY17]